MDRARQAAWDAKHLRTATTKLPADDYAHFKHLCNRRGSTPYAILLELVRQWMDWAE